MILVRSQYGNNELCNVGDVGAGVNGREARHIVASGRDHGAHRLAIEPAEEARAATSTTIAVGTVAGHAGLEVDRAAALRIGNESVEIFQCVDVDEPFLRQPFPHLINVETEFASGEALALRRLIGLALA